jgi:hypothetical protein
MQSGLRGLEFQIDATAKIKSGNNTYGRATTANWKARK